MIRHWQTWAFALTVGPLAWLIFIFAVRFLLKEFRAVRKWYWGLPIYQYPAMLLIVLGARHIRKPYGEWKKFDDHWWFTVKTPGFEVEEKP